MKIIVDLTARTVSLENPLGTVPESLNYELEFHQNDRDSLQIAFKKDGAFCELPPEYSVIELGAVKKDLPSSDVLFYCNVFTKTGTGVNAIYKGRLQLATDEIAELFNSEPLLNIAQVEALFKIRLLSGDLEERETVSSLITVQLFRDIFASGNSPNGSSIYRAIWNPLIVGLTGGGETKLDGLTTAGILDADVLVIVSIGGTLSVWKLSDTIETTPSNTSTQVVPIDFNATTNKLVWTKQGLGAGTGTVTDFSASNNHGVSFTVANATTTPVLGVSLGAITPTQVILRGAGGTFRSDQGSVMVSYIGLFPDEPGATNYLLLNIPTITGSRIQSFQDADGIIALVGDVEDLETSMNSSLATRPKIHARSVSPVTLANSAAETTIVTFGTAGIDLGATGALRVRVSGEYFNNTGGNRTLTLKLEFGGTVFFADVTSSLGTSTGTRAWELEFTIQNTTALSQVMFGQFSYSGAAAPVTGYGNLSVGEVRRFGGAGTVNTGTTNMVVVKATHSGSPSPLLMLRVLCWSAEFLPPS